VGPRDLVVLAGVAKEILGEGAVEISQNSSVISRLDLMSTPNRSNS
jgi:hypothetical protein